MKIKQLKDELSKYPDNMDVYMAERKTEFKYGLLNGVSKLKISFVEDPHDEAAMAMEDVIILDEE